METETRTQTIYTEVAGTTCYLGDMRGTVTGLHREHGRLVGAFVKLDGAETVLFVSLGAAVGDRGTWHEALEWRSITRDEFDNITGLAEARFGMGWR